MAEKRWMKGVLATDSKPPWNGAGCMVVFFRNVPLGTVRLLGNGLWDCYRQTIDRKWYRRSAFLREYKGIEPPAPGEAFEVELEV